jgi:cell fate (sporulation/competence/biofilm development) regulator YmcA (YheA/YmcA/DUF963 family)
MTNSELERLVDDLAQKIQAQDYVQQFQALEAKLMARQDLKQQEEEMKALQKEAILLKQIKKYEAYRVTMAQAVALEDELMAEPLVQHYRAKMQDVNDLLQHLTDHIQTKVNGN